MYRDDLIRAEQAAQKLTVEQLALKSKLNKNTVSDIRHGKQNVELPSLKKVADALGLPLWRLFENSQNRAVNKR